MHGAQVSEIGRAPEQDLVVCMRGYAESAVDVVAGPIEGREVHHRAIHYHA